MKPIDAITGLPRSAEVARLMTTQLRHGEVQSQVQTTTFTREMQGRQSSVNQASKAKHSSLDSDGGSGEGGAYGNNPGGKNQRDGEKDEAAALHPEKGKILDIRGSA